MIKHVRDSSKPPLEIRDRDSVQRLVQLIEIDAPIAPCKCRGHLQLEFSRSGELLASISFAHRDRIKWGRWTEDWRLTDYSAAVLCHWLEERGCNLEPQP